MVDANSRLAGELNEKMIRVFLVGLACSHPNPMARLIIRGVVQMIVDESKVPLVPRTKPAMSFSTSHLLLSLQDGVSDLNGMVTISTSSSEQSFTSGGGVGWTLFDPNLGLSSNGNILLYT